MKSKTLLLFIFLSLTVTAQNWQPINKAWHYNYRFNNANLVTNTILVDSAKAIGADSVFYLNRILLDCDTCHAASFGSQYNCDSCFVLGNQPQFLQRTIIKKTNGIYQFKDTGSIVFPTLATINTTWLFDSLWNISATVISINIETILGTNDSVKTILLSSGDTIKFSKSFGITLYPYKYGRNKYHRLTGIEELQIGEHVPDFKDIYNFNVGDVFCYATNSYYVGESVHETYTATKSSIHSKSITDTSITYYSSYIRLTTIRTISIPFGNSTSTQSSDSGSGTGVIKKINDPFNYCAQKIVDGSNTIIKKVSFTKDANNKFLKIAGSIGNNNPFSANFGNLNIAQTEYTGSIKRSFYYNVTFNPPIIENYFFNNFAEFNDEYSYEIYKEGLGFIGKGDGGFEHAYDEALVGYIKNGIAQGTIFSDDYLLSTNKITTNQKLKISPNPCSTCYISGIENPNDILVFDILGQSPTQPPLRGGVAGLVIDMENYSAGIYFVRNLKSGEIIKFVKQ